MMKLDAWDKKILTLLQRNNRLSQREIADRISLSPSAVYYVTGDFDFLLVINVRDMAEYEALTRELFFASGNIKSFRTIVSMQNAKQEMTVIIE